eukprot:m.32215 g.32215  ORF g.32215 m.32215 type:complete len:134 (-) comp42262_c0_seq1:2-403(-)
MLEQDNDSYQNESRRLHEEERKIREAKRQLIEKESKLQAAELSRQRAKPSTNQKDDAGDDIYTYHNSAATAASSEDVDFIDTSANEAEDVYTYHNVRLFFDFVLLFVCCLIFLFFGLFVSSLPSLRLIGSSCG